MLAGNTVKGEIAYGVIAGVMWATWVAAVFWGQLRSTGGTGETGEKVFGKREGPSDHSLES